MNSMHPLLVGVEIIVAVLVVRALGPVIYQGFAPLFTYTLSRLLRGG